MSLHDLEADYETLYTDGWRQDPLDGNCVPVGSCDRMCSYDEMQERERCGLLHKYEVIPNTKPPQVDFDLAIKEFKRSSVGREFARLQDLRPWSVLKKTLDYLLNDICQRDDDWMLICDFVFDRLKAVRQDMVIQRIEGSRYVQVLEGSVRFLIYSMYRLTCTLQDYTEDESRGIIVPLEGTVKGLNNYEMNVVREIKLTVQCLRDCIRSLLLQYETYVPDSPNRPLFEAINLIVNLPFLDKHQVNTTSFQSRSDLRNQNDMFKTVFRMYCDHMVGNHLSALKQLPKLTEYPLIILAYAPAIAQLQVLLIELLKRLYATRGSNTCSLQHLCSIICPNWLESNDEERLKFGKLIAVQFRIYNDEKNLCDFKIEKSNAYPLPGETVEKPVIYWNREQPINETQHDNETRLYALQMVAGKNWSLYKELLDRHGVDQILSVSEAPSSLSSSQKSTGSK